MKKDPLLTTKLRENLHFTPPALREVGLKLAKVNGINLAQGLCLLPTPGVVMEGALVAITNGHNLYSPAQGRVDLREALARKLSTYNKIPCTYEDVLVTCGATGAFEAICEAYLDPGDEVVTFIPSYPYHRNLLARKNITIKYAELHKPNWNFDEGDLKKAFTNRTKFVLITNPHNPTGKVFSKEELLCIAKVADLFGAICVTDEVYEYMTYEGREHVSLASLPDMFERTLTMGSYSKTFAITGWRIGYLACSSSIMEVLRTISDQIYVCAPTPLQHGVTAGIQELGDDYYGPLKSEYLRKRDLMRQALEKGGFEYTLPQGAYYMLADTSKRFPGISSEEAVDIMINRVQVGAVPASDFMGPETKGDPVRSNFFRFSFAVPDDMLIQAGERLAKL